MQRPRVYSSSSSSNETILEAFSSSPATRTPGPADVTRGSFPSGPSSHLPHPVVPLRQSLASGLKSTAEASGSHGVVKGRPLSGNNKQGIVGVDADGNDDSEESIDWDADSDEDTAAAANIKSRHHVVKRAKLPQTMGFHFDWWIARIATAAVNLDFKVLCASMMLWRERNEVLQVPTYQAKAIPRMWLKHNGPVPSTVPSQIHQPSSSTPPPDSMTTLRGVGASPAWTMDWDVLLEEIRQASEKMHQDRKWKLRGKKNAAGWCKWGAKQRVKDGGEFVEKSAAGYEVEGEGEGRTWVVRLGYRRNDAVAEDMDLDGEAADADGAVTGERSVEGEEGIRGPMDSPTNSNGDGLDVAMEEAPEP
ncbi:uncharacterized protein A1O5_00085 [Cladophialophora psammophila CBS 110553]|uniref:Uncharacterized protein n=1 Tax=Cladophialophora psammophila CBS 110553 TaxID=1182543 RepID=W9XZ83_9EURO|nr:uncharacterized protein A1O5_00085 [Cladophialophora psammophila CBS 110553]EXJ75579.1 hypothetical protein A1O5_00085 [Cladophialophora psammophila CBS 110553]